jgi:hypothetical protein
MKFLMGLFIFTMSFAFAGTFERSALEIKTVLENPEFKKTFGNEPINKMFRSDDTIAFSGNDEACYTIATIKWKNKRPVVTDVVMACE